MKRWSWIENKNTQKKLSQPKIVVEVFDVKGILVKFGSQYIANEEFNSLKWNELVGDVIPKFSHLPRKSEGVPKPVAAAAAKCDKCNPGCSIAGTLVGRTGLEVVLSDGELLGDRLSDFELYSNLISTGFDNILSIENVDFGIDPLLQSRIFISSFRGISLSLSLLKFCGCMTSIFKNVRNALKCATFFKLTHKLLKNIVNLKLLESK